MKKRRAVVDWMCEVCEDLKFEPEAIHHSVALFDSYFSLPHVEEILAGLQLA